MNQTREYLIGNSDILKQKFLDVLYPNMFMYLYETSVLIILGTYFWKWLQVKKEMFFFFLLAESEERNVKVHKWQSKETLIFMNDNQITSSLTKKNYINKWT